MNLQSFTRATIATLLLGVVSTAAEAQGKAKGAEKKAEKPVIVSTTKPKEPRIVTTTSKGEVASELKSANRSAKAKSVARGPKKVSASQALIVTREVLLTNGYQVVNVVPTGATQVIYYRRGNRGNGRGLGPVQKMVIVPAGDIVRFQSVPDPLLTTILRRLGL
jgi:hypothetical protein